MSLLSLFGQKNVDSILAKFLVAIDELDEYVLERKAEAIEINSDILELEAKRSYCQHEVTKAEKVSANLKKLLED